LPGKPHLPGSLNHMKFKIKVGAPTKEDLDKLKRAQVKKLTDLKAKGYTKEQLYCKFPQRFVDNNF